MDFFDYNVTVEIRSVEDPHVQFGEITGGSFVLDQSASALITTGSILMVFSICMLAMSGYKTYRFCIKYTLRNYLRERKMRKY